MQVTEAVVLWCMVNGEGLLGLHVGCGPGVAHGVRVAISRQLVSGWMDGILRSPLLPTLGLAEAML